MHDRSLFLNYLVKWSSYKTQLLVANASNNDNYGLIELCAGLLEALRVCHNVCGANPTFSFLEETRSIYSRAQSKQVDEMDEHASGYRGLVPSTCG